MWLFAPKNGKPVSRIRIIRQRSGKIFSLRICKILNNSLLCENIALLCKIWTLFSKPAQIPIFFSLQIGLHFAS